jgi:Lrp/AsnC family transcriptional regulator, leucine-responsive regulatory protein
MTLLTKVHMRNGLMMMDDIDIKILEILQKGGRTRRNDLAEAVGLSLPSVSERLRKLEEGGIISGYYAKLDPKKLGKDITAFIHVTVDSSKHYGQFIEHAHNLDEILECHAITGDGTHLLKVRTTNTASLEKLLAKIQAWGGVMRTHTNLVLSTAKETTRIKIDMPR